MKNLCFLVFVAALPSACSSSDAISAPVSPAPDGAVADAGDAEDSSSPIEADAGTDSSHADAAKPKCNDLQNVAAEVSVIGAAGPPPEVTGGTIADGTYVLTSATRYGESEGPTGQKLRMTVRFDGTKAESIFDNVARSATWTIDGTTIHAMTTCPSNGTDDLLFSATPTALTTRIELANEKSLVYVFAKQP